MVKKAQPSQNYNSGHNFIKENIKKMQKNKIE